MIGEKLQVHDKEKDSLLSMIPKPRTNDVYIESMYIKRLTSKRTTIFESKTLNITGKDEVCLQSLTKVMFQLI